MSKTSNTPKEMSGWAQVLHLAAQKDRREQPWKAALEMERKAKQDGVHDLIVDVSKNYPDVSGGLDDGSLRACNF